MSKMFYKKKSVQDEKLKQYYQAKNKSEQFWKPFTYGAIAMAIFTELIKRL